MTLISTIHLANLTANPLIGRFIPGDDTNKQKNERNTLKDWMVTQPIQDLEKPGMEKDHCKAISSPTGMPLKYRLAPLGEPFSPAQPLHSHYRTSLQTRCFSS